MNVTNAIEKWNEENPESQIEIIYTEADLSVVFEHIQDGTSAVSYTHLYPCLCFVLMKSTRPIAASLSRIRVILTLRSLSST